MPFKSSCAIALLVSSLVLSQAHAGPVISEFMAANKSALYDEDGESSDWIELHNPDSAAIDLGGYFLTNDPGHRTKWQLPSPTSLPAGGTLIVFASNKDRDVGELHANFRLSKNEGSYLALVDNDGQTIISEFADYPEQFEDFSYGLAQTGSTATLAFVQENDACTLLVPTGDIGTTWKNISFDDTGWRAATTGIGYERSGGYENLFGANSDVESETYGTNSTVYIRIPFSVASFEGLTSLTLRMKYDDGFIAYLNGVEVASGNPPSNPPTWNSDASSDHSDNLAVIFEDTDITVHAGVLRGSNVLTIHLMNGDTTSSDLLALPRLEAEYVSNPGLGDAGYFQQSSPGTSNGTDQGLPAGPVTFSVPGRGFTGSFSVSLSTPSPAAQIRYTTNGNVPTTSSSLYTSPISVRSSTLMRARSFEAGLAPGVVGEQGYIRLASSALSFSSDIPVVIMERFSGGPTAANGKTFTFFAFFEPDPRTGRTLLNKPYALGTRGGWKVRGSSSAGFAKKAFSIEAWNEFNRNKNISPLGLPEESDWILNARSVFDRSLMRNAFIFELSNQTGRYATRTKFVELFKDDNGGDLSFNNDYDGVYTFMEKISRDKERVDVERLPRSVTSEPGIAGGYMLKIDRLDPGDSGVSAGGRTLGWVYPKEDDVSPAQVTWIRNHINDMNVALNATDYTDPVTGYAKYIDVDSWVDHHLLNVLALNADALRLSTYFFKTRDGKIESGPIWDFDRSMESTDSRDNNPSTWSGGTNYFTYPWWSRLFTDENFWQNYIDRYFELRDESWSTANVHAIIDGMAAELNESQVRNFQRWSDQPRFGSYRGEVNHLKDWLGTRLNWMDGQFAPRPNSNRAAGIYAPGTTVTLNASLTGGQKIFYTLDGSDPRPQSDSGTVSGTTLFDETQPIRVLVPTTDIGTTWRGGNEPFNDSTWIAGINGVGYERSSGYESFINVDVNSEMATRTTCYIRIPFNVDGAELATWNFMTLQMRYDDGFVAYLNGTRLVGSNDPSPLLFGSSAVQTNDDGSAVSYENFNVTALLGSLQAGQNILAIHALNESTGSSDFLNQSRIVAGFDEGGGNGTGGIEYTGPITLTGTSRLFARVFDPSGGHSTNSRQTPVGTGWSAPLEVEYLVNEVPANSSNLIISEIMHDPYDLGDALTEDGAFEWIELQNISGGPISLTGVRFLDGIEFVFPGRSLSAGERVLVVRNQAAFEQVYGTGRSAQIAGQFDLALDNLGELLILTAANGAVIQSFAYSNSGAWPAEADNGYSLQFESGDPADGANWLPSRSLLGSPGTEDPSSAALADIFVNEVLTNSVTPLVDEIELYNPNIGDLNVGGWFLTDDLSQPEKFRIPDNTMVPGGGFLTFDESDFNPTPGVGISFALDSFGEEVFLIAATPTGDRLDYLSGFDFGDASAGVTYGRHVISTGAAHHVPLVSATLGNANSTPVAGPLVITELMYHPAPFESEFVEIQNISGQAIPLANAEVSGIGFVFDTGAPPLAPGGIVVLSEIDPATFRSTYNVPAAVAVYGPYPGNLDNGGERVRVGIPESTGVPAEPDLLVAVDTVIYSDDAPWPLSADGSGNSLERSGPGGYGGEPLSWEASDSVGGTPGLVGPVPTDWRSQFFTAAELANPNISGIFADADGDKLVNALEYLLGSDLRDGASRNPPEARVVELGGQDFVEFSFILRDGVTEFVAEIQESSDLQNWSDASGSLTLVNTTPNGDGTSTLTYRGNSPIDPAVDLYFRVRAGEVP
jgi:hypothetical protein